jgi:predicted ATP-grasp superfamily ATP-dependent carboligase
MRPPDVLSRERLIILGSSLTALAVARDAHALGMEPVVVDTKRGIAFDSRWVRQPIILPPERAGTGLAEQLLADGTRSDYVIATSDAWLRHVIAQRKALEEACREVLHPSNAVLETCLDKAKFAAWCTSRAVPSPRTWFVGNEPRPKDLKPPFLVRPANTLHAGLAGEGSGLPKAVEASDEAALDSWLRAFHERSRPVVVSESLLQESLTQFSVPFVRTSEIFDVFVARKARPAPKHCSVGSYVELAADPELEQFARRIVEGLDYFGIGEAEVLRVDATGRLFLIEINARPWLQYALAPASGHDFLGTLMGRPRRMRRIKDGRRWINFESDLFVAFSSSMGAVRRGELGLGSYLKSLLRANVYARFDVRDPLPALRRLER